MNNRQRLDMYLVKSGQVPTRSQAESWIRLGKVTVNGKVETKPGFSVAEGAKIKLTTTERYVSRAGLKLASVATALKIDFTGKAVLDVGSSTGGFTDYALQHGATKVIAVDVGTEQLHPTLRKDKRVELHEKTDIRTVISNSTTAAAPFSEGSAFPAERNELLIANGASLREKVDGDKVVLKETPDITVIDVSFISLREILPHIADRIASSNTQIVAMVKPQFEAGKNATSNGIVKNDSMRRKILKDFELWARSRFLLIDKADSEVAGAHGNRERFYLLKPIAKH